MATLAAQILTDRANVFLNTSDFAETITYGGVSISAIVDVQDEEVIVDGRQQVKIIPATCQVSTADVSNPAPGDTWVHNSITYVVERIGDQVGGMATCHSVHRHAVRVPQNHKVGVS